MYIFNDVELDPSKLATYDSDKLKYADNVWVVQLLDRALKNDSRRADIVLDFSNMYAKLYPSGNMMGEFLLGDRELPILRKDLGEVIDSILDFLEEFPTYGVAIRTDDDNNENACAYITDTLTHSAFFEWAIPPNTVKVNESMEQEYSSADTSLNQVSGLLKNYEFEPDSFIVDYGGGKYDLGKEYIENNFDGCILEVIDKYNRSDSHNQYVMQMCYDTPPDYITCANVLNVIKEDEVILEDVLEGIRDLSSSNTTILFTVYDGDRSGKGRKTTKGYQRNQKLKDYIPLISQKFRIISTKKGIIQCQL